MALVVEYSTLYEYLDARRRGDSRAVERRLLGDREDYPWLAGFYQSLLEEAIAVVGEDRLAAIVAARDELVSHKRDLQRQAYGTEDSHT